MPRGGARPNSGRPKGVRNAKTLDQVKAVVESGITPLEYLMSIYRNPDADEARRIDAAKAAAPYVHPKLANVDHTSSDGTMSPPSRIVLEAERDDSTP